MKADAGKGLSRVVWNFRYPSISPASLKTSATSIFGSEDQGPLALPGDYSVSMSKVVDGVITELVQERTFRCKSLGLASLPADDRSAVLAFQDDVSALRRVVLGTNSYLRELTEKLQYMKVAAMNATEIQASVITDIRAMEAELAAISRNLRGDRSMAKRQYPTSLR
jgi:hypothetical protein